MNKIKTILILTFFFVSVFGQHWEQKSFQTFSPLNKVYFLNENIGWATGSQGGLIKTIDGGVTWELIGLPTTSSAYSVHFVDENTGYVGVTGDIIFKTTNGGSDWTEQVISSIGGNVRGLYFSDANTGWALTSSSSVGAVYYTTNGGSNWTEAFQHTTGDLEDMAFSSAGHGICVGGGTGKIDLYYTKDGVNWTKGSNPTIPPGMYTRTDIRGVTMYDDNFAFAVGWGSASVGYQPSLLIKSTDGGETWELMQQSAEDAVFVNMYAVTFKDEQNGVAFGGSAYTGTVGLKTVDGGTTWIQTELPFGFTAKSVSAIGDQLVLVGSGGALCRSEDFGENWELITQIPSLTPYAFEFVSDDIALAAGYNGLIIKTTDRGQTWTSSYSSVDMVCPSINDIDFLNENIIYLAKRNRQVCKSTNGGETWTAILKDTTSTSLTCNGVSFVNESFGCAVGKYGSGISALYITHNGGQTWETQIATLPEELNYVKFLDENNGVVVGDEFVLHYTTNGGTDWTACTVNNLPTTFSESDLVHIEFFNNSLGLVSGDCLLKTTDGGKTWDYVEIPLLDDDLVGSKIIDENTWIVAGSIFAYKTHDGGLTWEDISYADEISASSVWALSTDGNNHPWLAGSSSSMYQYANPVGIQIDDSVPTEFHLFQNYPNPFSAKGNTGNPSTTIKFAIPNVFARSETTKQSDEIATQPSVARNDNVRLTIYNSLGQQVAELINKPLSAGNYEVTWNATSSRSIDGRRISSGVYFYKLTTPQFSETKKMLLIK